MIIMIIYFNIVKKICNKKIFANIGESKKSKSIRLEISYDPYPLIKDMQIIKKSGEKRENNQANKSFKRNFKI